MSTFIAHPLMEARCHGPSFLIVRTLSSSFLVASSWPGRTQGIARGQRRLVDAVPTARQVLGLNRFRSQVAYPHGWVVVGDGCTVAVGGFVLPVGGCAVVGSDPGAVVDFFAAAGVHRGGVEAGGAGFDVVGVVVLVGGDVVDGAAVAVVVVADGGTTTVTVVVLGSWTGFTSGRTVACAETLALALALTLTEIPGCDAAVSAVALGALVALAVGAGSLGVSPVLGEGSAVPPPTVVTGSPAPLSAGLASPGIGASRGISDPSATSPVGSCSISAERSATLRVS
ncbi:hypothetical protein [Nocardia sp. NPDC051570]|uniref:hypothetical protein n=1 Tax=Nocardia sp. NPDC051570 TaxID=3364324 RepID=UPI0037A9ED76